MTEEVNDEGAMVAHESNEVAGTSILLDGDGLLVDDIRKLEKGAFVPRGIIVEGVATMVILWTMIQPCVIVGKFFPREVEIRMKNITGYGGGSQTTLDFVLRNDALDKHGNGDFRVFQRGKTDKPSQVEFHVVVTPLTGSSLARNVYAFYFAPVGGPFVVAKCIPS